MAPAMCIIPAYDTGDWLGSGLSASVVHRVSALAQRSMSIIQVSLACVLRPSLGLRVCPQTHATQGPTQFEGDADTFCEEHASQITNESHRRQC